MPKVTTYKVGNTFYINYKPIGQNCIRQSLRTTDPDVAERHRAETQAKVNRPEIYSEEEKDNAKEVTFADSVNLYLDSYPNTLLDITWLPPINAAIWETSFIDKANRQPNTA